MKISVIGSNNIDMVVKTQKMPLKGETIFGKDITYTFGGKGANQAISASRLGGNVTMFGAIGDDDNGKNILKNFKNNGVCTSFIKVCKNTASGIAIIYLAQNDNCIVVVAGANDYVDIEYIDSIKDELLKSDIVLLQHEIPPQTIEYVAMFCKDNNIDVILNPAPAREITENTLKSITYITPNETEFDFLIDKKFNGLQIEQKIKAWQDKNDVCIIVTQGKDGICSILNKEIIKVDALNVDVVDTTGAGDTFNGALAYALVNKYELKKALAFAGKCASISITKFGAQGGMPTLDEANNF